jgi:hypothetical protein
VPGPRDRQEPYAAATCSTLKQGHRPCGSWCAVQIHDGPPAQIAHLDVLDLTAVGRPEHLHEPTLLPTGADLTRRAPESGGSVRSRQAQVDAAPDVKIGKEPEVCRHEPANTTVDPSGRGTFSARREMRSRWPYDRGQNAPAFPTSGCTTPGTRPRRSCSPSAIQCMSSPPGSDATRSCPSVVRARPGRRDALPRRGALVSGGFDHLALSHDALQVGCADVVP